MSARSSQLPALVALTQSFGDINAQLLAQNIPVKVQVVIIEFLDGDPENGTNQLTLSLSPDGTDWIFG